MIKYAVYKDGKIINYRHPIKVLLNTVLRLLQFWTMNKYIIVTYVSSDEKITGCGFRKIKHKYYFPKLNGNI